jgi:hypothetical protein
VELCTSYWEELILMCFTILLSLSREIKKIRSILVMEEGHG